MVRPAIAALTTRPRRGLTTLHRNRSYANSVIQALYFSAPFRYLIESYIPYGYDAQTDTPGSPNSAAGASLPASPPNAAAAAPLSASPSSPTQSTFSAAGKAAKAVGAAIATPYTPVSPPSLSIRVPPGGRPPSAGGGSRGALFSPTRRQSVSSNGPTSPSGFSGGAPLSLRSTQGSFTGVGAPQVDTNGVIVKPVTGGETTLLSTLRDLFCAISSQPRSLGTIGPQAFINQLKRDNEFFRSTLHQDAHEFFNVLLNSIAETLEVEEKKRAEDEGRPPSASGCPLASHHLETDLDFARRYGRDGLRCAREDLGASALRGHVDERDAMSLVRNCEPHSRPFSSGMKCSRSPELAGDIPGRSLPRPLARHSAKHLRHRLLAAVQRFRDAVPEEQVFLRSMRGVAGRRAEVCPNRIAQSALPGPSNPAPPHRIKVKKLPNILALHLKRFKYEESLRRHVKLTYRVVFPFELRLFNTAENIQNPDRLYELWAVVVHIGVGPHHGHYITVVKSGKRWIVFDDNNVFPIEENEISRFFGDTPGQGSGYVLFYQAVDLDWSGIDIPPPPTPSAAGTAQSRGRAQTDSSVSTGGLTGSVENGMPAVPPLPTADISTGLISPTAPPMTPLPMTPSTVPAALVDPTASLPDSEPNSANGGAGQLPDEVPVEKREAPSPGGWSGLRGRFSRTKSSSAVTPSFGGSEPLSAIQSRGDGATADDSLDGHSTPQATADAPLPVESPNLPPAGGFRGRLPSTGGASSTGQAPSEDGSASVSSIAPTTASSPFFSGRRRDSRNSFGAAEPPMSSIDTGAAPLSPGLSSSGAPSSAGSTNAFAARTRSFLSRSRSEKNRPPSSHGSLPASNGYGLGLSTPSPSASEASPAGTATEPKQRLPSAPSGMTRPADGPPASTPSWVPASSNGSVSTGLESSTSSLSTKDLERRQKEEQKVRDREAKERAKAEKDRVRLLAKQENGGAPGKLWRKMSFK